MSLTRMPVRRPDAQCWIAALGPRLVEGNPISDEALDGMFPSVACIRIRARVRRVANRRRVRNATGNSGHVIGRDLICPPLGPRSPM